MPVITTFTTYISPCAWICVWFIANKTLQKSLIISQKLAEWIKQANWILMFYVQSHVSSTEWRQGTTVCEGWDNGKYVRLSDSHSSEYKVYGLKGCDILYFITYGGSWLLWNADVFPWYYQCQPTSIQFWKIRGCSHTCTLMKVLTIQYSYIL